MLSKVEEWSVSDAQLLFRLLIVLVASIITALYWTLQQLINRKLMIFLTD